MDEGWMCAPGMIYRGRAGPSKMIELTPFSLPLIGAEVGGDVEVGGETKTAGRIGPSKMSTHSLTFSLFCGVAARFAGDLIPGEGSGGGTTVDGTMGNIWACLEIEDE